MAKLHYRESPTPSQKRSFAPFLAEDEELILVTGFGRAYLRSKFIIYLLFPGIIFGVIGYGLGMWLQLGSAISLLIGLILAIVGALLKTMHTHHANRYLLTTRRVLVKQGIFSVKLTSAMYDKITRLEVDQAFFDRLFLHHGTIVVNTAGMSKAEIVLKYVDYPMEFKNLMERLINREREHFGVRSGVMDTVEGEILN